jgi:hypothetical protein
MYHGIEFQGNLGDLKFSISNRLYSSRGIIIRVIKYSLCEARILRETGEMRFVLERTTYMSIAELTRWLLLGLVSDEEIKKDWDYQPGMNFEKLCQFIEAAEKYSEGKPDRQVEFLEIRLPLVIREKNTPVGDTRYCIEMEKVQDGKVVSTIKTNSLANRPSDDYASRLMKHLGAQSYRILVIQ